LQVPVLLSPGFLQKPISDSLDITFWVCERHPDLRPSEHAEYINSVLQELHAINFFTLSMRNVPERANMMEQSIQDKINAPELSERHRKALEYKLTV
jgi:glutathione S-transferase